MNLSSVTSLLTGEQWTQLVILGSVLFGLWKEARNRKWRKEDNARNRREQKEDRDAATAYIIATAKAEAEATRIKNQAVAETLKLHQEQALAQVREDHRIATDEVTMKLETVQAATAEAIAEAKVAYTEANNISKKIAEVGLAVSQDTDIRLRALETPPVVRKLSNRGTK